MSSTFFECFDKRNVAVTFQNYKYKQKKRRRQLYSFARMTLTNVVLEHICLFINKGKYRHRSASVHKGKIHYDLSH